MTKIDFAIIAHNGQPFFGLNLQAIYPFANRIIVIEGPVAAYRKMGFGQSNDGTLETLAKFSDPDRKIVFESSLGWDEKDSMLRATEKHLSGDFVWCVDCDEFYLEDDMRKVISYLNNHSECYSMSFKLYSFFGTLSNPRYISGFEAEFETHRIQRISPKATWKTHRPPTLIWAPNGKTCREMGHVDGEKELGVRIYHFSHMPPKRMRHKSDYYQWLSSSILPNYFNRVYVPWMRARTDEERLNVEKQFEGVQEFKKECRSPAYTLPFQGKLPDIIEKNKSLIEAQINLERGELGI